MGQVNELKDFTRGQLDAALMKIGQDAGVDTAEGIHAFLRGDLVVSRPARPKLKEGGVFRLTVDYSQSLEQMVAAGYYDWSNRDITAKRFPIVGTGVVKFEARYFHFDRNISSENAVKKIESADTENPWMPAKIEHELAHGKTFPDEQRKFPIVGLGSVALVDGARYVPYLGVDGSGRDLRLRGWVDDWGPGCRFLAVREVSVS